MVFEQWSKTTSYVYNNKLQLKMLQRGKCSLKTDNNKKRDILDNKISSMSFKFVSSLL